MFFFKESMFQFLTLPLRDSSTVRILPKWWIIALATNNALNNVITLNKQTAAWNLSFYLNPQLLNNIHSDWPEEEEEEEEEIVIQHFFGSIFCLNHSLFCTRNSLWIWSWSESNPIRVGDPISKLHTLISDSDCILILKIQERWEWRFSRPRPWTIRGILWHE